MIDPISLPRGAVLLADAAVASRSFAAGFWFRLGSRHEAPQERGFVHFVEHLVFKGTKKRGAIDIAREIDRVGGYLNAFTERDLVCLHCVVPARMWRLALDLLSDLAFNASFPPEEVEREREVIVSEILASRDEPEDCSHDRLLELVWPGDPLSRSIAGEPEDIERAARDELYAFYKRHFQPEGLVVSVAGPVPVPDISAFIAQQLEPAEIIPLGADNIPTVAAPRFRTVRALAPAQVSQVYLYEALSLEPPFKDEDYYVLSILNGALGESMSSRLFQNLRERKGLCYSVYSAFALSRTEGLWLAQANSSLHSFPALLEALDAELDLLFHGRSFSEREVEESVSRLAGSFDLALDDPEYRMKRLARQWLYSNRILDEEETRGMILAVDKDSVDQMVSRLFERRPRAVFAYGRVTKRALRALQLSSDRLVEEITYG